MNNDKYISEWQLFLSDRGVSQQYVDQYLPYVSNLNKNNAPIIFEFEHLSLLLGIQKKILAAMINHSASFYRTFEIPKRKGGSRKITAPYPSLLQAQNWIYKNILIDREISEFSHGFTRRRSIITNTIPHTGKKHLLKIDLKDFFPSISKNFVVKVFLDIGYAHNVAFYLASLCCHNNNLAQGASTSPALSNIVCRSLDNRLSALANSYNLCYSRYADDIVFSGDYITFHFFEAVTEIINDYGFNINTEKSRLYQAKGKRIVTGISVEHETIRIPREYKREVKKQVFFIRKYGFFSHASKTKIKNPFYLESLYGKLLFWTYVEPECKMAQESANFVKELITQLKN